jgi:hypothetical protein
VAPVTTFPFESLTVTVTVPSVVYGSLWVSPGPSPSWIAAGGEVLKTSSQVTTSKGVLVTV